MSTALYRPASRPASARVSAMAFGPDGTLRKHKGSQNSRKTAVGLFDSSPAIQCWPMTEAGRILAGGIAARRQKQPRLANEPRSLCNAELRDRGQRCDGDGKTMQNQKS